MTREQPGDGLSPNRCSAQGATHYDVAHYTQVLGCTQSEGRQRQEVSTPLAAEKPIALNLCKKLWGIRRRSGYFMVIHIYPVAPLFIFAIKKFKNKTGGPVGAPAEMNILAADFLKVFLELGGGSLCLFLKLDQALQDLLVTLVLIELGVPLADVACHILRQVTKFGAFGAYQRRRKQ
jgi:hypothetical protein